MNISRSLEDAWTMTDCFFCTRSASLMTTFRKSSLGSTSTFFRVRTIFFASIWWKSFILTSSLDLLKVAWFRSILNWSMRPMASSSSKTGTISEWIIIERCALGTETSRRAGHNWKPNMVSASSRSGPTIFASRPVCSRVANWTCGRSCSQKTACLVVMLVIVRGWSCSSRS